MNHLKASVANAPPFLSPLNDCLLSLLNIMSWRFFALVPCKKKLFVWDMIGYDTPPSDLFVH